MGPRLRDRLAGMLVDALPADQLVRLFVPGEQFRSIALLQPEVLNRVQESRERPRLLLGFVVDYLAGADDGWQARRTVSGRQGGASVDVVVRDALWLGDLKMKAWIPTESDTVRATRDTLRDLLDPRWLANNSPGVELLTSCFGFDALELRLLGATEDPAARQALRDELADLVAVTGPEPGLIQQLLHAAEERRRRGETVQRLRNVGLAVQAAVGAALKSHRLKVELWDDGYDFDVSAAEGEAPEDLVAASFRVGGWLVEVKATERDEVTMTPKQARTAAAEVTRYVLCVVALTSASEADRPVPSSRHSCMSAQGS